VAHVTTSLPDVRTLLYYVSFRIGEGTTAALCRAERCWQDHASPAGGGRPPTAGSTSPSTGLLGVMRQFIARTRSGITPMSRPAALRFTRGLLEPRPLDSAELACGNATTTRPLRLRFFAAWPNGVSAGVYDAEVHWDACTWPPSAIPTTMPLARRGHAVRRLKHKRWCSSRCWSR